MCIFMTVSSIWFDLQTGPVKFGVTCTPGQYPNIQYVDRRGVQLEQALVSLVWGTLLSLVSVFLCRQESEGTSGGTGPRAGAHREWGGIQLGKTRVCSVWRLCSFRWASSSLTTLWKNHCRHCKRTNSGSTLCCIFTNVLVIQSIPD